MTSQLCIFHHKLACLAVLLPAGNRHSCYCRNPPRAPIHSVCYCHHLSRHLQLQPTLRSDCPPSPVLLSASYIPHPFYPPSRPPPFPDLPFNGALVTSPHTTSSSHPHNDKGNRQQPEGLPPAPHPIAWLARDSSKPGRVLPPGCAEMWVVHASPEWSNERAGAPKELVMQQLLGSFLAAAGAVGRISEERDVLYLEAHAWSNA